MGSEAWAQVARDTRDALALLGFPIEDRCLPDEPQACGGDFSEHAMTHLVTIKAVCDHQLSHLRPPDLMAFDIYERQSARLREDCATNHD
jgi:hypothetical protein